MSAPSVTDTEPEWGKAPNPPPSASDEGRRELFAKAAAALVRFHSPGAYLEHHMPDAITKKNFLDWQLSTFPMQDDVVYCFDAYLPPVEAAELGKAKPTVLHIAAFAWGDSSSIKPSPGEDTCNELLAWIEKDGFVTGSEPIRVAQPEACKVELGCAHPQWQCGPDRLLKGSVGYLKGRARMETMIMVLHMCHAEGIELNNIHPQLFNSLLRIYVFFTPKSSKREEALENMAISCKGSIRKAPNIITISKISLTLKGLGDGDHGSFIKTWNERAPKKHQVVGQKAVGLKLVIF